MTRKGVQDGVAKGLCSVWYKCTAMSHRMKEHHGAGNLRTTATCFSFKKTRMRKVNRDDLPQEWTQLFFQIWTQAGMTGFHTLGPQKFLKTNAGSSCEVSSFCFLYDLKYHSTLKRCLLSLFLYHYKNREEPEEHGNTVIFVFINTESLIPIK